MKRSVLIVVLLGSACHRGDVSSPSAGSEAGRFVPATLGAQLLIVQGSVTAVNGPRVALPMVVDTGAPRIDVDIDVFPALDGFASGAGVLASVDVGGLSVANAAYFGTSATILSSPPVNALLGCTFLCQQALTLDYRGTRIGLGSVSAPSGLEVASQVGFILGGGLANPPASRVVVTVAIERRDYSMIVDSGATYVGLRTELFDQIAGDGRPVVTGPIAHPMSGPSPLRVMRTSTLAIGDASVARGLLSSDSALDVLLDQTTADVGQPIDGNVGATFLRGFYTTIDYPNRMISFAPYASVDFIQDEWFRVGLYLDDPVGESALVRDVYPGSDAATKGVAVGDQVVRIAGQPVAAASASTVSPNARLSGAIGSKISVTFGTAQSPSVAGNSLDLLVEDALKTP